MAKKRRPNPNQPELPGVAPEVQKPAAAGPVTKGKHGQGAAAKARNGNGETHVLAENVPTGPPARPFKPGKIELPLHRRVEGAFSTTLLMSFGIARSPISPMA